MKKSPVRNLLLKKAPSTPDTEHLHQLIFLYLNKSFEFNKNLSNLLSGIVICLYNLLYFIIIFDWFSFTVTLVYSVLLNVFFYNLLYFFLKTRLIKNKQNG